MNYDERTALTYDLARHNRSRLTPGSLLDFHPLETTYVEDLRAQIRGLLPKAPTFAWYEQLLTDGPGQADPLFPWLAMTASRAQMVWFLSQEGAGEAGFGDLVAMAQVGMPNRAKLEMARNYWDEVGRGEERGMHDLLLRNLLHAMLVPQGDSLEGVVPEALQLSNLMVGLCTRRRYAWLALGALGVIEMTAPGRVGMVDRGLERLGVSEVDRRYFTLHAVLDVKHSREWNREVIEPLPPDLVASAAEGAYLRLWAGAQCFARYRREFGLG